MITKLDQASLDELAAALSGSYSSTLCGGRVRVLCRPLPGRAVCAAQRAGDVLYIVVDLAKPNALCEARQMLSDWRAEFLEPTFAEDGSVALVPLARIPEPGTRGGYETLML